MIYEKPFLVRFARAPIQPKLEATKADAEHSRNVGWPPVVTPRPTIETAVNSETSDDR